MTEKRDWVKTTFRGVRYRKHPTRKHGVKFDQYFTIRYKVRDGDIMKDKEEGLGWASEGWNAEKAFGQLTTLKENQKLGSGPKTLSDRRRMNEEADETARKREEEELARLAAEGESISEYFDNKYFPCAENDKAKNTSRTEKILFDHWIRPVIGHVSFQKLSETDVARVKKQMEDAGKAPKTLHHTLALIRQMYNYAKRPDIYLLAKAKMPRIDNAKLRYLTASEISTLLAALKDKSEHLHDQALLSVNTGLRFSEVAGLQYEDINYQTKTLAIRDAKTGSRTVFFNDNVLKMLKARQGKKKKGLVFPIETGIRKGERQAACSKTFHKVADKLFNKGVNDRRLRVSFHTLRHTFGTHVYAETGDLYVTQKTLGHRTLLMAQRYAKMGDVRLRAAFDKVGDVLNTKG